MLPNVVYDLGVLYIPLNTHNPTTGAAQNADATPTFRIYKEANPAPVYTGSFTLFDGGNTTGYYLATVPITQANGFEPTMRYTIYAQATVAGILGTRNYTFMSDNVVTRVGSVLTVGQVTNVVSTREFDTTLNSDDAAFESLLVGFITGPCEGQAQPVENFISVGGKIITFEDFTTLPLVDDYFAIYADRRGVD